MTFKMSPSQEECVPAVTRKIQYRGSCRKKIFHSWSVVLPADVCVRFTPNAVDSNLSQGTERYGEEEKSAQVVTLRA